MAFINDHTTEKAPESVCVHQGRTEGALFGFIDRQLLVDDLEARERLEAVIFFSRVQVSLRR